MATFSDEPMLAESENFRGTVRECESLCWKALLYDSSGSPSPGVVRGSLSDVAIILGYPPKRVSQSQVGVKFSATFFFLYSSNTRWSKTLSDASIAVDPSPIPPALYPPWSVMVVK